MKLDEVTTKVLKRSELLTLVGYNASTSKINKQEQLVFYFIDTQCRVWTHHQVVRPSNLNSELMARKYLSNLGFNMVKTEPFDLYVDFFNEQERLKNVIGRVYEGKLVHRILKGDSFGDNKKHHYFDIDDIYNTRNHNQEILQRQFDTKCGLELEGKPYRLVWRDNPVIGEAEEGQDFEKLLKTKVILTKDFDPKVLEDNIKKEGLSH